MNTSRATRATPSITQPNGRSTRSTSVHRSPNACPSQASPTHQTKRPDHRIDREAAEPHRGDPGRQADERPDEGHQAAVEHHRLAVAFEPGVRTIDLMRSDQEVPAEPVDDGSATQVPHAVGEPGPHERSRDGREDDPEEREFLPCTDECGARERASEEQRDLARERDAGRIEQHEDEDGEVAVLDDQPGHRVAELGEHSSSGALAGNTPSVTARCCGPRDRRPAPGSRRHPVVPSRDGAASGVLKVDA